MNRLLRLYFDSWWVPAFGYLMLLVCFLITSHPQLMPSSLAAEGFFCVAGLALLGLIAAAARNLIKKQWGRGITHGLLAGACGAATLYAFFLLAFALSRFTGFSIARFPTAVDCQR